MIIVINFGSQFAHLIARRFRELGVYSEIKLPYEITEDDINKVDALVLSGGPDCVNDKKVNFDRKLLEAGKPLLGICYGHQLIASEMGGKVEEGSIREYGATYVKILDRKGIFSGLKGTERVWMAHGDTVVQLPKGFMRIAESETCKNAAIADYSRKIISLQFHPEVYHTEKGMTILDNFIRMYGIKKDWDIKDQKQHIIEQIRETVEGYVVMAVSGGVDSLVASFLIKEALDNKLYCVYVDSGLMRKNEAGYVEDLYSRLGFSNFEKVDASALFIDRLKGVSEPEEKRKIIGHTFIEVFERKVDELKKIIPDIKFLGQGTIYPDRIESGEPSKTASKIKSHHNITLPEKMRLRLVEPLKELYKDEVRKLGMELGISEDALNRHPFPGPGLAIRVVGEVTKERLDLLREADLIFTEELKKSGHYHKVWQALAALLPVKTVGVMGDARTYEEIVSLRAVTSVDGMTADWAKLPYELLERVSARIVNEVRGINRVVYDITQKPPGTIEYE